MMQMTANEVSKIVKETVAETLKGLGVDTSDPLAMQRDFAHVRSWRESTEAIKHKGMLTVLGILITGAGGLIWLAIKSSMHWE